jgi:hypothetical protein
MMYEDALREVLNRVYRNTDDCEMLSIKSAPAAADYWLRQGYSLEDTNELIKASTALSKTGLISSAEAAQYLTSAIGGFAEGMSNIANSARLAVQKWKNGRR